MTDSSFNRSVSKKDLYGLFLGVVIGGFGTAAALASSHSPLIVLLGLATFYPAMVIGVCMHEYGHALGAWSSGGRVSYIQLGRRYPQWKPWEVRFLGVRWLINSAPFSGAAHVCFLETTNYRLRQCWMIACGPLVNLALLIAGLLVIHFGRTESNIPYLAGWCVANAFLLGSSLIPRVHKYSDRLQPSDSLLFSQTLRYSDNDIEQMVALGNARRELAAEGYGLEKLDLSELLKRHEADPYNFSVLWLLSFRLVEARDPRCLPYLLKLLEDPRLPARSLSFVIDIYLTNQLHAGPPEDIPAADELSQRLLDLSNSISTRGTRGSVLVDIGRIEEGKAMLQEVLNKTESDTDKTYSLIFLALAEKQRGNVAFARAHAAAAQKINSACPALKRVSELLPA